MKRLWIILAAFLLAACATTPPQPSLNALAERYVKLTLAVGEVEEGYIDAYYGPPEWAAAAKAAGKRPLSELSAEARSLTEDLARAPIPADRLEAKRRAFLIAQARAVETRLQMLAGAKLSFQDEAQGLFDVRPELRPLESFDAALARIDRLVPGDGDLAARVERANRALIIPTEKLEPVMRAAIAECRARTVKHLALPANESFRLEFVKNQPWGGYNWYKGDAHSLIEINTDLPVYLDRAVDLGCHEGYPGHHTMLSLMEERLVRGRGWIEFAVYPLYAPQSFLAEGTANLGVEMAFPGEERARFEAEVLAPLAGIDPAAARRSVALRSALQELGPARYAIADAYLAGRVDRAEAVRLTVKYQALTPERADKSIAFLDRYRSYIINYGLGLSMARAAVAKAGADPVERWKTFERLIAEPTTPADLR